MAQHRNLTRTQTNSLIAEYISIARSAGTSQSGIVKASLTLGLCNERGIQYTFLCNGNPKYRAHISLAIVQGRTETLINAATKLNEYYEGDFAPSNKFKITFELEGNNLIVTKVVSQTRGLFETGFFPQIENSLSHLLPGLTRSNLHCGNRHHVNVRGNPAVLGLTLDARTNTYTGIFTLQVLPMNIRM